MKGSHPLRGPKCWIMIRFGEVHQPSPRLPVRLVLTCESREYHRIRRRTIGYDAFESEQLQRPGQPRRLHQPALLPHRALCLDFVLQAAEQTSVPPVHRLRDRMTMAGAAEP